MLEFGTSFRKARESQNVSIDKIAVETRINSRFLLAIENEQFELLPGGIFNRGFIRSYAVRLGLDPEEAILAYEQIFRPVEMEPANQEPERVRGKTTKIPVYYVAIAGLVIFVVVFYLAMRQSEPVRVAAIAPATASPATEPAPPPAPEPVASPIANATISATTKGPAVLPTPVTIAAAVAVQPAAQTPTTPAAPAPAVTNASIVVELEAKEETWFRLVADGKVATNELLQPGTSRRFSASTSMEVSVGNAGGIVFRLNGQPVSSLGKSGRVRSFTITPTTTASSLAETPR
ncbi:MAG TPA: helix-turn-helix domain-containing protein [Terriglobia bacterium]|nr:helix-turn-helix domain-containing protein [Terriglobia bacterium]